MNSTSQIEFLTPSVLLVQRTCDEKSSADDDTATTAMDPSSVSRLHQLLDVLGYRGLRSANLLGDAVIL